MNAGVGDQPGEKGRACLSAFTTSMNTSGASCQPQLSGLVSLKDPNKLGLSWGQANGDGGARGLLGAAIGTENKKLSLPKSDLLMFLQIH